MRPENRCIEYVSDRETKRYRKCSKCYYRIISILSIYYILIDIFILFHF